MKSRPVNSRSLHRPGFSLIELCVIMAALAVALAMMAIALGGALKVEKASAGALQWLQAQRDLADQFRADVAQAVDAPERWREEVAGPTCLILRPDKDRHIVYRWQAERLVRSEFEGEKVRHRDLAPRGEALAVEFERPPAGGRLLTLRLFTVRKDGNRLPASEITAALGGDLQ